MASVADQSTSAKNPPTSSDPSAPATPTVPAPPPPPPLPPRPRPALRWDDPDDVRAWLDALRADLDDAAAYTREATAPKRKRTFTRRYLRRTLDAAMTNLATLVSSAERGLARGNEAPAKG